MKIKVLSKLGSFSHSWINCPRLHTTVTRIIRLYVWHVLSLNLERRSWWKVLAWWRQRRYWMESREIRRMFCMQQWTGVGNGTKSSWKVSSDCFTNESIRSEGLLLEVRFLRRCTKQFAGPESFVINDRPRRPLCAISETLPRKIFSPCSLTLKDNWHNQIYFGPLFVILAPASQS